MILCSCVLILSSFEELEGSKILNVYCLFKLILDLGRLKKFEIQSFFFVWLGFFNYI